MNALNKSIVQGKKIKVCLDYPRSNIDLERPQLPRQFVQRDGDGGGLVQRVPPVFPEVMTRFFLHFSIFSFVLLFLIQGAPWSRSRRRDWRRPASS